MRLLPVDIDPKPISGFFGKIGWAAPDKKQAVKTVCKLVFS